MLRRKPREGILTEEERVRGWSARGYKWPPTYLPNKTGWKRLFDRRFRQLERIDIGNNEEMYNKKVS